MGKQDCQGLDYEGGFLTETQRKYLAADCPEKTLEDYSNPSVWKRRVRGRYEGALMDLALLGSSPEMDVDSMKKAAQEKHLNIHWQYKENAPLQGVHAAKGVAQTYGDDKLLRLIHPMESVAQEAREREEFTHRFLVKAILRVLKTGDPNDDDIVEFLSKYWPDKEAVVQMAKQEMKE